MRVYAIGDIHGQLELLRAAHRRIALDRALWGDMDAPVVHLGDFCDRGPDVSGVLDHLIAGADAGAPWVFLRGNHDRMMAYFLCDADRRDPLRDDLYWLQATIGGRATLASYGVDASEGRAIADIHAQAVANVPARHRLFLEGLHPSWSVPDVFFCHAGVRPGVALDQQTEDDLVWIREPFLSDRRDHGALVVHGHSPVGQPSLYANRLNIDTGAAYGGPLTVAVIEDGHVWWLSDEGRTQLFVAG
ncbi:MAG: serine/threonine protein phosphatase 1 [Paracoccaceae bacterium]|jgi:serine/threonine protein phosphatase 1